MLAASIPPEEIALDKLPVGDGKGVLTSRLKYFHKAILNSPPRQCSTKNLERVATYMENYKDIYFRGLLSIQEILEIFYPRI